MTGILVVSAIAALGVLTAGIAIAIPGASRAGQENVPRWESPLAPQSVSLRDRINRPFQAIADRSNRQHRLNGGLTLAEHLARAELKLRTSEFVMIQGALLVGGRLFSLWRFCSAPRLVVAGVVGYLSPMRSGEWR